MVWLWILAVVLLLTVVLLWTRVGVWVAFGGGDLRLDVKFGLLRLHILPARKSKPKKPPKEKEATPPKPSKGKKSFSFTLEDGKDALRTLLPALGRALKRIGRGVRVRPLRLSLVLGGQEDPAAAAEALGKIQAAVWAGMPQLERLLDIPDPRIYTDVDFTASAVAAEGEAGISFRVGTLLAVGFGMAFPALGWFLRWRKRCKTRPPKMKKPKSEPPAEKEAPQAGVLEES